MLPRFKHYFWLGALILLLTACGNSGSSKSNITITPYNLSEKENLLMNKADVTSFGFFELSGALAEEDDFQMSLEVYENGVFKEKLLSTSGSLEEMYKKELLSFVVSGFNQEEVPLKLVLGMPSGSATTQYTNDKINGHSFSTLIDEKITLKKNEPVYLAAWIGTTTGTLRSVSGEVGKLPEGLEEAEFALLYKVILTDQVER